MSFVLVDTVLYSLRCRMQKDCFSIGLFPDIETKYIVDGFCGRLLRRSFSYSTSSILFGFGDYNSWQMTKNRDIEIVALAMGASPWTDWYSSTKNVFWGSPQQVCAKNSLLGLLRKCIWTPLRNRGPTNVLSHIDVDPVGGSLVPALSTAIDFRIDSTLVWFLFTLAVGLELWISIFDMCEVGAWDAQPMNMMLGMTC